MAEIGFNEHTTNTFNEELNRLLVKAVQYKTGMDYYNFDYIRLNIPDKNIDLQDYFWRTVQDIQEYLTNG